MTKIDELVAAYQAGATVDILATRYHVHRATVGKHLQAHGIDTTPPGLDPVQLPEAIRLYHAGWSLARIADKFESSPNSVGRRLVEAGVKLRPRGWPTRPALGYEPSTTRPQLPDLES